MRARAIFAVASAFWAAFALFTATELYLAMFRHGHSYTRILAWQFIAWQPWALVTPLLARLTTRIPLLPLTAKGALTHGTAAVVIGSCHVALYVAIAVWLRPYDAMSPAQFLPAFLGSLSRLHSDVIVYLGTVGVAQAVDFYSRFKAREVDTARLESSLARARLETLKLQLHPHFLFNTLHAVGSFIRQERSAAALEVLAALGDVLRYSLSEQAPEVPLRRELESTDRYLHIHRMRFSDRLTVSVTADEEALAAGVPPLILQPLVENAITHGVARSPGPGAIEIRATREGERLRIDVLNTGAGLDRSRRGVGLANTEERLRRLYGAFQRLDLDEAPGGARASIIIPFHRLEPADS